MADLLKTIVDNDLTISGTTEPAIKTDSNTCSLFNTPSTIYAFDNCELVQFGSTTSRTTHYLRGYSQTINLTNNRTSVSVNTKLSEIAFYRSISKLFYIETKWGSNGSGYLDIRSSSGLITRFNQDGKNIFYKDTRIKNLKITNSSSSEIRVGKTYSNISAVNLFGSLVVYGQTLLSADKTPYTIPDGSVAILQGEGNKYCGVRMGTDSRRWYIYNDGLSSSRLIFSYNGGTRGFISSDVSIEQNLINFTGQHRCTPIEEIQNYKEYCGLIVVSEGSYNNMYGYNNIEINEALPKIRLSNKRNQKSVLGVVSNKEEIEDTKREYTVGAFVSVFDKIASKEDTRVMINSIGEGGIWVCNINGNLKNGDHITSCEIPGYGMKQDIDIQANYTVAKITCDCDFDLASEIYKSEEFEWEGNIYRRAFVGCTYHCG